MAVVESDLAVRAARAEIERDAAIARAEFAERTLYTWMQKDKEALLDTLHIIGIPARDIADIFRLEMDWRRLGGNESRLEFIREHERYRKALEEIAWTAKCGTEQLAIARRALGRG